MGWNDHIDFELNDQLSDLLDGDYLREGTPAYGVACQVIGQGLSSLTAKQRIAFDAGVVPAMRRQYDASERRRCRELLNRPD